MYGHQMNQDAGDDGETVDGMGLIWIIIYSTCTQTKMIKQFSTICHSVVLLRLIGGQNINQQVFEHCCLGSQNGCIVIDVLPMVQFKQIGFTFDIPYFTKW